MIGTGVFIVPRNVLGGEGYTAPSDQLALAAIGSGGKGTSDISNAYQNGKNRVVALCDVDPAKAKSSYTTHADVNKYIDYREMLDKEKGIDALTISTPDHNHAKIAYDCMNSGIHVYVQKPLTHSFVIQQVAIHIPLHMRLQLNRLKLNTFQAKTHPNIFLTKTNFF